MKRVGILYHPMIKAAHALARELEEFTVARSITTWTCSAWEEQMARERLDGTDMIICIGGDGTILRAAHVVAQGTTPIVGVNLGKLGFMTEFGADEAREKLPGIFDGHGWIDERTMLEAQLAAGGEGQGAQVFYALNDVVVARGAIARLISIEASIDEEPLTTYRADGVILATATGSTGYSMVAGGPVLNPKSSEILLMPILPHLSMPHCLVLSPDATVRLRVLTKHQATLCIDGHVNLPLNDGAALTVMRSKYTARFLRLRPRSFFYCSLEKRLKGNS